MPVYAKRFGDGVGRLALRSSPRDLMAQRDHKLWSADFYSLRLGSGLASPGPIADLLRLDLCQRREQGEQDVTNSLVVSRQMRFRI
jgi:hypothetical protein